MEVDYKQEMTKVNVVKSDSNRLQRFDLDKGTLKIFYTPRKPF